MSAYWTLAQKKFLIEAAVQCPRFFPSVLQCKSKAKDLKNDRKRKAEFRSKISDYNIYQQIHEEDLKSQRHLNAKRRLTGSGEGPELPAIPDPFMQR